MSEHGVDVGLDLPMLRVEVPNGFGSIDALGEFLKCVSLVHRYIINLYAMHDEFIAMDHESDVKRLGKQFDERGKRAVQRQGSARARRLEAQWESVTARLSPIYLHQGSPFLALLRQSVGSGLDTAAIVYGVRYALKRGPDEFLRWAVLPYDLGQAVFEGRERLLRARLAYEKLRGLAPDMTVEVEGASGPTEEPE